MLPVVLIVCAVAIPEVLTVDYNTTNATDLVISTNRTGKFGWWWLGIGVGVVRFENAVCPAANGLQGICYTRRQCSNVGGFASGRCARNIGVCCVVQVTCGAVSSNNNTYFSNPNFPNTFTGATTCTLTIQRCNPDICQVRLDFLSLTLAQPNGDGECRNDVLFITGAASVVGRICGDNTGLHMYLDFNGGTDIVLTIVTSTAATFARQWNIRVAQIGCDSTSRAPSGCLMYYRAVSGSVRSFNYGLTANPQPSAVNMDLNPVPPGTRQLANMNYGICVGMEPGYCSIQWSASNQFGFSVSSDTADTTVLTGSDTDCPLNSDYVIIPDGQFTVAGVLMGMGADRYCGNVFPSPVTTSSKPFVLTTVTNANEDTNEIGNRGFSLSYTQQLCGSDLIQ